MSSVRRNTARTVIVDEEHRVVICDNGCEREYIATSYALNEEEGKKLRAAANGWLRVFRNGDGEAWDGEWDFCGMGCLLVWAQRQQYAVSAPTVTA